MCWERRLAMWRKYCARNWLEGEGHAGRDCSAGAAKKPSRKGREKWGTRHAARLHSLLSVVKAVAKLNKDFARIVPVESAEGDAVVEFDAAVGQVHGVY